MSAWLYAVVSSSRQEETLANQAEWARKLCDANGWHLERVFSAVTTGKRGVRKLLVKLIAELKATSQERRPQRVLMLRLDRVGRGSIVDSQVAVREIRLLGPIVHTRDGGDQIVDGPMGELIEAAKFAVSSFENEVRRQKSLDFHVRKREAGEFATTIPFGFVLSHKRLVPHEPEAAIVRGLFEKRVAGWGYQRLAVWAAAVAPPKRRPNGATRTLGWGATTVRSILANPRYRGTIVNEATFDAAATMRGKVIDRPSPRWNWPLRGAIRCVCGALLLGEASGRNPPKGYRTRYYVCRRMNQHDGRYPHHNAQRLEEQFAALLEKLRASKGLASRRSHDGPIQDLRMAKVVALGKWEQLTARRTRTWELAEDGTIGREAVAQRVNDLSAQIDAAEAEVRRIDGELAVAERRTANDDQVAAILENAAEIWKTADTIHQRSIAMAVSDYLGGLQCDPKRPHRLLVPRDA